MLRHKKGWRPSQWKAWCATTVDDWGQVVLKQCKFCDEEKVPSQESRGRYAPYDPRPMPDLDLADVPEEALWLAEACTRFSTDAFGNFVSAWMQLPKRTRKLYSHSGAVQALSEEDPVHYTCPHEHIRYFDPTNWIYAQTLQVMCPALMSEVQWNNETKGDTCESIMGMHYVWRHGGSALHCPVRPEFGQQLAGTACMVNAFVYKVYKLYARVGDLRVRDFLNWSINMARWRVDQAHVQLVEVDREVEQQWPRRKEGRLAQVLFDVQ